MADQFVQVTTQGFGSRIINSIKGVVVGLLLFLASFGVLFWNEGQVDLSIIAKTAAEVSSTKTDSAYEGKLVAVTGLVTADNALGDTLTLPSGQAGLKEGKYIALQRKVEMYAWTEQKKSESQSNTGGSSTTKTTYNYTKTWTDEAKSASSFKNPTGHENPVMTIQNFDIKANNAKVGNFSIDINNIALPAFSKLSLQKENALLPQGITLVGQDYIYTGVSYQTPIIGDYRISYKVLNADTNVTVFGQQTGSSITAFLDQNNKLYHLFLGSKQEGIAALHGGFVMMIWIFRLMGFLMMWIGLTLVLGPFSTFLDFLPMLGSLSSSLISAVTFVIALVLSGVTILISMIFHSAIAVAIFLILAVVGIAYGINSSKQKKANSSTAPLPNVTPLDKI